jgi:hypothetical protein
LCSIVGEDGATAEAGWELGQTMTLPSHQMLGTWFADVPPLISWLKDSQMSEKENE